MKRVILVIGLAGLFLAITCKGYAADIEAVLDDADGVSKFVVKDSDNVQVLGVSSDGDITLTDTAATVDPWIGLGASAGRIEFDDQTTDEINFLNANVGIGTTSPATTLDVVGTITLADDETIESNSNQIIFRSSVDNDRRFVIDLNNIWYPRLYGYGDDNVSRLYFGSPPILGNGVRLTTGNSSPAGITWVTSQGSGKHYLRFETELNGSQNASGYFMFTEEYDNPTITSAVANPTIRLASADPTKYIDFWHDQTNAYIDWSTGGLILDGGNVGIGTTEPNYKLEVAGAIMMEDSTAPTASTGHSGIYSSSGELYALDSAGNSTLLSPHDKDTGEWIFYSKNTRTGRVVRVNMEKLVKAVERLTGEQFMVETYEEPGALQ